MPVRQLTLEQIARLQALLQLPHKTKVPTRDALLIARVGSIATWQRLKKAGLTPPATLVNNSTELFEIGACLAMVGEAETETEEAAAA